MAGTRRITFAALDDRARRLATFIAGRTMPGDRVAILAQNVPEYAEVLYAAPGSGRVLTLLNYRLHPVEWARILARSGTRLVIVQPEMAAPLRAALDDANVTVEILEIGPAYDAAVNAAVPIEHWPDTADDAPALLIYTSGTTGTPKGALLTHRNIAAAALLMAFDWQVAERTRFLMAMPMCHASGLQLFVFHLRQGPVVLLASFDAGDFLRIVQEQRIETVGLAPTMIEFVLALADYDTANLTSLRSVQYGGMPMPPATARRLAARFPNLVTGFGQTESSLMITRLTADDHRRALAGEEHLLRSCGRAGSYQRVAILDPDGRECPTGEVGELCVRSDLVMRGYLDDEPATAAALEGGWLHCGDLAWMDSEGFVFVVDRKSDMLVTGGQNVYPREIEQVIAELPEVANVAVLGVPDRISGEERRCLRRAQSRPITVSEDIVDACRARLAGYKKPKHVVFLESLPMTATGKVRKAELRDRWDDIASASQVSR